MGTQKKVVENYETKDAIMMRDFRKLKETKVTKTESKTETKKEAKKDEGIDQSF